MGERRTLRQKGRAQSIERLENHYLNCQLLFSLRMDFPRSPSVWFSSDISDTRARNLSQETLLTTPRFRWNIPAPCHPAGLCRGPASELPLKGTPPPAIFRK